MPRGTRERFKGDPMAGASHMKSLGDLTAEFRFGPADPMLAVAEHKGVFAMPHIELSHGALKRRVVTCSFGTEAAVDHYVYMRNAAIARMIADLQEWSFAGEYQEAGGYGTPPYFVPHHTLIGRELAEHVGIRTPDDIYGGVVPYAFLATKAISHGLVGPRAQRPQGWSTRFSDAITEVVLPGFTAFSIPDAHAAGITLLTEGAVRVKPTLSAGGKGQSVIHSPEELAATLAVLDPDEIASVGVVLESNLDNHRTYSIGQVKIEAFTASYYGVQRLTKNNQGVPSYGGSDLVVVRGGFDRLLELGLPPHLQLAVSQAARYDHILKHYPHIIASRSNYDVGQGFDGQGTFRSGVFEQSWRIGGASGPEVAALHVFRNDPTVQVVEAASCERYGKDVDIPAGALVHFADMDPKEGPMTIYTVVTASHRERRPSPIF